MPTHETNVAHATPSPNSGPRPTSTWKPRILPRHCLSMHARTSQSCTSPPSQQLAMSRMFFRAGICFFAFPFLVVALSCLRTLHTHTRIRPSARLPSLLRAPQRVRRLRRASLANSRGHRPSVGPATAPTSPRAATVSCWSNRAAVHRNGGTSPAAVAIPGGTEMEESSPPWGNRRPKTKKARRTRRETTRGTRLHRAPYSEHGWHKTRIETGSKCSLLYQFTAFMHVQLCSFFHVLIACVWVCLVPVCWPMSAFRA